MAGAVGMQQAIEHHNRSDSEPLGVRIGMSAGEAVEEDDDYFGDPVVEAARLCAAANGGQILAGVADEHGVLGHLARRAGRPEMLSFEEIEEILGRSLPQSGRSPSRRRSKCHRTMSSSARSRWR